MHISLWKIARTNTSFLQSLFSLRFFWITYHHTAFTRIPLSYFLFIKENGGTREMARERKLKKSSTATFTTQNENESGACLFCIIVIYLRTLHHFTLQNGFSLGDYASLLEHKKALPCSQNRLEQNDIFRVFITASWSLFIRTWWTLLPQQNWDQDARRGRTSVLEGYLFTSKEKMNMDRAFARNFPRKFTFYIGFKSQFKFYPAVKFSILIKA